MSFLRRNIDRKEENEMIKNKIENGKIKKERTYDEKDTLQNMDDDELDRNEADVAYVGKVLDDSDGLEKDISKDNVIEVRRTMGKKGRCVLGAAIVLIVVGLISAYWRYSAIKTYEDFDTVKTVETSGDNIADYLVFAGNVLKVTKDGASYIDENGLVKWDVSYAMKMPKAEVCGEYAIVADMNGKDVYIFTTEGEVSRQTLSYDISNVDIAEQGVYCLVLAGEDGSYITGYDKDSKKIYEKKASIDKDGYPLDVDISNDGVKLIVSYLRVNGVKAETVLSAYNFGSVGQNKNADRLMDSFAVDDSVYPIVKFIDNDTIACFGDKDIRIYTMVEEPKEKAVIDLEGREMQGVFYNSSCVGYIALANSESGAKYQIYVYGNNGSQKAVIDYSDSYNKMYASQDEIIVVGDMDCSIFRLNGSTKFKNSFDKKLVNVVPDANKDEYVVISESETQIIALK